MTRAVRQVTWVLFALIGVLIINLQAITLLQADGLADQPTNTRQLVEEYATQRGPIVVGDDAVARSVPSSITDDPLAYLRSYPFGTRGAHVIGWDSIVVGASGIEEAFDEELSAAAEGVLAAELAELLGQRDATGSTVRLTLDPDVQAAAERALGDNVGAVVAIDPRTGEVLAHASTPTFDATPLADHDPATALAAWDTLRTDPGRPLLDRATRELYPPGSTFKLIVAAAALEAGLAIDTSFPDDLIYQPPVGQPIRNYSREVCSDGKTISLARALELSCNTVFARLGVELGQDQIRAQAQAFGFDRSIPYDLPVADSVFPKNTDDAQLAQSSIGQFDVRATAMQMAVVVAAIANDGKLQTPHVVRDVRDASGRLMAGPQARPWDEGRFGSEAVSQRTATLLQQMMVGVVERGTGTRAVIPGVRVGGKTGTAQDPSNDSSTAWFVGFAEQKVAVAVVLPDAGGPGGGQIAAPIARAVMEAALRAG
jgi:peptidoglycan glycosyltransferase